MTLNCLTKFCMHIFGWFSTARLHLEHAPMHVWDSCSLLHTPPLLQQKVGNRSSLLSSLSTVITWQQYCHKEWLISARYWPAVASSGYSSSRHTRCGYSCLEMYIYQSTCLAMESSSICCTSRGVFVPHSVLKFIFYL